MVDDEDFEWLTSFRWFFGSTGYVWRQVDRKTQLLHRVILDAPVGMEVDHIDGNRLNNQRSNLRVVTRKQNRYNTGRKVDSTSIYRGVSKVTRTGLWQASIQKDGVSHYIGTFDTEEEAALAYNKKATELYGEYARLNIVVEVR